MDVKLFVNTDDDIRLSRRLIRDTMKRGRSVESVLVAYNRFVKKAYDEQVRPTMKNADIVIPRGAGNKVALNFICSNLSH